MDIEELNKAQVILLVLLVSFVTSIATGIVTVSLLAQAPPAVTQTVNHIIQRTVEAVTPGGTETPTTVKETTVVVKEDDLVTGSITSSFDKLIAIHDGTGTSSPVVALGVVLNGGLLISDSNALSDGEHLVESGATSTIYTLKNRFTEVGVATLVPTAGAIQGGFRISGTDALKLGQSLFVLPSATGNRVGIGSLSARYILGRVGGDKDEVTVRALETNITGRIMGGAPLFTISGDVVGIATGVSQGENGSPSTFVALSDIAPVFLGVKGTSTPAVSATLP